MSMITASLLLAAALINSQQAINEAPQPEALEEAQEQTGGQVGYECELCYYEPEPAEPVWVDSGYEDTWGVGEASYAEQVPVYSGGLTAQSGVNYFGGRTETYYSSNVLRHYRTDEWTVDEEGFYRTPEGYYVVAASDMEQGSVFETSKGEAMVLDSGCAYGVTDFYVAW